MKAKINRFLLGISVILALFISSCSNVQDQKMETEQDSGDAVVKLSIFDSSRAAFPEMTTDKITEFTLTGSIDAENAVIPSIDKTWTSTDSATAYAQMSQDKLALSAGSWTFTLTAVAKDGGVVLATYTATKTVTISSGENSLDFELKLESVNVENEAGAGTLKINIALGSDVSSRVAKMTGKLLNSSGNDYAAETDITGSTYTVNNVTAGLYTAEIRFYADEEKTLLLGTYPEAVNINKLGAASKITVNSLDKVFTITYKAAILGETGFKEFATNTNPASYTRNGAVSFTRPTAANAEFFKWILLPNDSSSAPADSDYYETGNKVDGIAKKTVGNKTYCALFVPDKEAKSIESIEVLKAGSTETPVVGRTVRPAPYYFMFNIFPGTINQYQWCYKDSEGGEHEIAGANTEIYYVEPKYCGQKLFVKITPKYAIVRDANDYIESISLNDTPVASTPETINMGQVAPDGDITSIYTETIVRGSQLSTDVSKLGSISGKFKDSYKETNVYTPSDSDCQISIVDESTPTVNSPSESSGTVNVPLTYRIKVKGVDGNFVQAYEDVEVTQKVFVNVKYETPGPSTPGLPTIYQTNDYEVTYGKLKFGSVNALYQYKIGSDEWRDFPASASEEISLPTSGDFSMYYRYKTEGTKNTAGYIEQSEPYLIHDFNHELITNPENNKTGFGKKVLIKSVSITGDAKVGGTLTANVTSDFTNTGFNFCGDGYGSIAWTWSVGGTSVYTAAGDHTGSSSFTIKNADIDTCWNKQITVKAVFTSAKADGVTNNKESTSSTISDGSLTLTGTVTNKYSNGTSILAGDTLSISSVDFAGITLKNSLEETVAVNKSRFSSSSITPEKAPDASGTLTVKFKLKGYSEQSVTVGINVKPAAPSFGGGEGSGGGSGTQESPFNAAGLDIFDEQPGNIPYGYIRFNYDSYKDNQNLTLAAYEYCTEATVTEASVWNPIIKNAENSDFPGTYDKKKADGTLFPQASPEESGVIYMRYRKRARVNYGISEDYVYYSFAKGYWVNTFDEPIYRTDNTTQIITDDDLIDDGRYGSITENSDPVAVALGPCVGTYREQISSIIVQTDGDLGIGTFGNGLKVENSLGKYVSFAWYVDDESEARQTGPNEDFELPRESLSDKYVIRVEATDKLGEVYTATATITISRN